MALFFRRSGKTRPAVREEQRGVRKGGVGPRDEVSPGWLPGGLDTSII